MNAAILEICDRTLSQTVKNKLSGISGMQDGVFEGYPAGVPMREKRSEKAIRESAGIV